MSDAVVAQDGKRVRTGRKASARREELLQTALELFATNGYHDTGVRDIADRVDILSGSIFHHFKTKESILEALMVPYFDSLLSRCSAVEDAGMPASEAVVQLINGTVATISEGLLQARVVTRDWTFIAKTFPEIAESVARADRIWMTVIEQGVHEGEFRSDVGPRTTYHMLRDAISGMANWYSPDGAMTPSEISRVYSSIFLNGFTKRVPPAARKR
jgi:AcrR family transcriptional regulator